MGSRTFGILLLCISVIPFLYGQKTRFGPAPPKAEPGIEYPISVHISGIRVRSHCSEFKGPTSCRDVIYAESVINQKKIELMGDRIWLPNFFAFAVAPGDYRARIVKDAPSSNGSPLNREYDLVLQDETIWRCRVTGFSE